jgi:hypothetical protein
MAADAGTADISFSNLPLKENVPRSAQISRSGEGFIYVATDKINRL